MKYRELKLDYGRTSYKEHQYSSISELQEYLSTTPVNRHFKNEDLSSISGDKRFTKTSNIGEAQKLLTTGWNTLAEKLAKKVKPNIATTSNVNRTRPTYGLVGGQASVPRYIQGIPTNMVDRKVEAQKQKIIVINKDIAYNARVRADDIEEEGIKALQIIQALENKGFRVKLNLCWASESDNEVVAMRLCVKKPEERLSLSKVAFPIAHPSMLRRIGFDWMEKHPTMERDGFTSGYGRPANARLYSVLEKNEVLLPNFIPDVDSFLKELKL